MKRDDRLESRPPTGSIEGSGQRGGSANGSAALAEAGAPALVFVRTEHDPFEAERCWQIAGLVYATGHWRRRRAGGVIRSPRVTRSWPTGGLREIRWHNDGTLAT